MPKPCSTEPTIRVGNSPKRTAQQARDGDADEGGGQAGRAAHDRHRVLGQARGRDRRGCTSGPSGSRATDRRRWRRASAGPAPCDGAKKSTNGPTTASKKPAASKAAALSCITASARAGSKAKKLAATPIAHQHRHRDVGDRPAEVRGAGDDRGIGDQDARRGSPTAPPTTAGPLVGVRPPPRCARRRRRCPGWPRRRPPASANAPIAVSPPPGSDDRHADQAGRHHELGQQHPAATAAEPAQQRHVDPVDDRGPEGLEHIGEPHPRDEADDLEARALVAQPVAKVFWVSRKGRPEAKPRASITATLGWRTWPSTSMTLRFCARARQGRSRSWAVPARRRDPRVLTQPTLKCCGESVQRARP